MDKRLINTLLRIFHSPDTRFASGRAISAFCAEYNLGVTLYRDESFGELRNT